MSWMSSRIKPFQPENARTYQTECCSTCRYYGRNSKMCACDDSRHFFDYISNSEEFCCEHHRSINKETANVHYPYCAKCGAYIPTGAKKCLACGNLLDPENEQKPIVCGEVVLPPPVMMNPQPAPKLPKKSKKSEKHKKSKEKQKPHINTIGNGFAPPVAMEPPPAPDLPKRNAENVLDIDLDAMQKERTVVRIKRNGEIKNYLAYPTRTILDFYIYPYTRCSDIKLVLELRALDVIEGE